MVLIGSMLSWTQITELGLPSRGLDEEQARSQGCAQSGRLCCESRVHPADSGRSPRLGTWVLAKTVAMPGCVWRIDTGVDMGAHTTFKRKSSHSTRDATKYSVSEWEVGGEGNEVE